MFYRVEGYCGLMPIWRGSALRLSFLLRISHFYDMRGVRFKVSFSVPYLTHFWDMHNGQGVVPQQSVSFFFWTPKGLSEDSLHDKIIKFFFAIQFVLLYILFWRILLNNHIGNQELSILETDYIYILKGQVRVKKVDKCYHIRNSLL